jgi:hypothetical protein
MQTNFQIHRNFIAKYRIYPETIFKIQYVPRLNPSNVDCVVNAMEILGILSREEAGLVRQRIGHGGIPPEQFLQKFREKNPEYNYNFIQISMRELIPWIINEMPSLSMIFCGYLHKNGVGHVYLIGKNNQGKIFLLDPQLNPPICSLETSDCFSHIANKSSYFILVRDNVPMDIEEFDNSEPMNVEEERDYEGDIIMNKITTKKYHRKQTKNRK